MNRPIVWITAAAFGCFREKKAQPVREGIPNHRTGGNRVELPG